MRVPAPAAFENMRRSPLVILGFLIIFVAAAYKSANYVIVGDMPGLAFVALAFVGCAFIVAMLNNWRNGLYFFLTWLLFEDFARKYLGNNMAIYFAKDVLAAVVYFSFFLAYRRKHVTSFRPPFLVPVLLLVWFGVMQVFNPASTHLMYGVMGVKIFFYYIPLLRFGDCGQCRVRLGCSLASARGLTGPEDCPANGIKHRSWHRGLARGLPGSTPLSRGVLHRNSFAEQQREPTPKPNLGLPAAEFPWRV